MKKLYKNITLFIVGVIMFLLVYSSDISKQGVTRGLIICSNTIIPSLFPFLVCVTMIIKHEITVRNKYVNFVLYKLFGHSFEMFFAFILSMIGGYPVGAKIISELYNKNAINNKTANIMLLYCVNAGPAFIISVVGGILGSKKLGLLLIVSHLISSTIISLCCAPVLRKQDNKIKSKVKNKSNFSENLVVGINDATKNIVNICSYIVLFSAIIPYFDYFSKNLPKLKYISSFLEITTTFNNSKNIYFISFLLGFAGISIWCQIFSITKNITVNKKSFILGRLLHGIISVIVLKILLSTFKIKVTSFSNNAKFLFNFLYSDVTLLISIIVMFIFFMIFLYTKNNSGKIINDVV